MKKIGVLTSGGDAPGMNAAIRAVVRQGISLDMEVYGIKRGFEGLLDGDIEPMKSHSVGDILQRGGTILRTARSKRFLEEEWINHGARILQAFGIEGLVIIGGEGSFKGGYELSKQGITVMGVPGTIDNDLGYTDFSIGFDEKCCSLICFLKKKKKKHDDQCDRISSSSKKPSSIRT